MRNAALKYRPVGGSGEPYPDWVRALDGKSGVYILRETEDDGTTETVCVGESHPGRLYQTLTRHCQTWRRAKKFWTGQYTGSQSHDPGLTYDRERITAAVRVLPANRALAEEARLIARLRPRDNLIGQPVDDQDEQHPGYRMGQVPRGGADRQALHHPWPALHVHRPGPAGERGRGGTARADRAYNGADAAALLDREAR